MKKMKYKMFFYNFFHKKSIFNYYQKHKERLQREASEKYQNLSEEEKDKRRKKFRERYQNLPEEQKQKLLEYMKNYYLAHKKVTA